MTITSKNNLHVEWTLLANLSSLPRSFSKERDDWEKGANATDQILHGIQPSGQLDDNE